VPHSLTAKENDMTKFLADASVSPMGKVLPTPEIIGICQF
jgi:hypothetical protein